MMSPKSYFSSRLPTDEEKRNSRWVTFTSEKEWDPSSDKFKQSEDAMRKHHEIKSLRHEQYDSKERELDGRKLCRIQVPRRNTASEGVHDDVDPSLLTFDHALDIAMTPSRRVEKVDTGIYHSHQRIKVDDATLGKRWEVSPEIAERTRRVTTQRGLRYLKGNLDRRFKTRMTQLQRPLLYTKVYADTIVYNSGRCSCVIRVLNLRSKLPFR